MLRTNRAPFHRTLTLSQTKKNDKNGMNHRFISITDCDWLFPSLFLFFVSWFCDLPVIPVPISYLSFCEWPLIGSQVIISRFCAAVLATCRWLLNSGWINQFRGGCSLSTSSSRYSRDKSQKTGKRTETNN